MAVQPNPSQSQSLEAAPGIMFWNQKGGAAFLWRVDSSSLGRNYRHAPWHKEWRDAERNAMAGYGSVKNLLLLQNAFMLVTIHSRNRRNGLAHYFRLSDMGCRSEVRESHAWGAELSWEICACWSWTSHNYMCIYLYISLLVAMHGTYWEEDSSVHSSLPKINIHLKLQIDMLTGLPSSFLCIPHTLWPFVNFPSQSFDSYAVIWWHHRGWSLQKAYSRTITSTSMDSAQASLSSLFFIVAWLRLNLSGIPSAHPCQWTLAILRRENDDLNVDKGVVRLAFLGQTALVFLGFLHFCGHFWQGLVTVPFGVYWTSPYSSHYSPHIPNGWVMFNGDI